MFKVLGLTALLVFASCSTHPHKQCDRSAKSCCSKKKCDKKKCDKKECDGKSCDRKKKAKK